MIVSGTTTIDEAMVTGESLPVAKGVDDSVIGSTMNTTGTVTFKATKVGEELCLPKSLKW